MSSVFYLLPPVCPLITESTRSDHPAKKAFISKPHQYPQEAPSPAVQAYLKEYDPYRDFLVTGHSSNPQRRNDLGHFVREWDQQWEKAGGSNKGNGGKQLALLPILVLPLKMNRDAKDVRGRLQAMQAGSRSIPPFGSALLILAAPISSFFDHLASHISPSPVRPRVVFRYHLLQPLSS